MGRAAAATDAGVLCLAGPETTVAVEDAARQCGLRFAAAASVAEALEQAASGGPWVAVVAALGTRRGVDLLLDEQKRSRSSLVAAAKRLPCAPTVVVYSRTACRCQRISQTCRNAGADAVVCTRDALLELLRPPPAQRGRVLCMAGKETTVAVSAVAERHALQVVAAASTAEAIELARTAGPWSSVVAALGTHCGDSMLFDRGGARSSLICLVKGLTPPPVMVVYSHSACRTPESRQACIEAGADAVVCTEEDLHLVVTDAKVHQPEGPKHVDVDADRAEDSNEPAAPTNGRLPAYDKLARYPLLAMRRARLSELAQEFGKDGVPTDASRAVTAQLHDMLRRLPRPLTLPATSGARGSASRPSRFLHVSDTHNRHDLLHLPPADVLLHTGDLTANYGSKPIRRQLPVFQQWLVDISSAFELIVIIAGNHDTILDPDHLEADGLSKKRTSEEREKFLRSLPKNVVYLENDVVDFRGLRIWGSPVTPRRDQRMLSDAFEWGDAERRRLWAKIPDDVDILLTHSPPRGTLSDKAVGCAFLAERLQEMQPGPMFHCFGHDHGHFGVEAKGVTIFLNGAQEGMRHLDKPASLCPWIFDVEPRRAGQLSSLRSAAHA